MNKIILLLVLLVMIPAAFAGESFHMPSTCDGLDAFEHDRTIKCESHVELIKENFIMDSENANLINQTKISMTEINKIPLNNETFRKIRALVTSISFLFLVILVLYTGYLFISSSAFPEKREHAKRQLKNIVILAIVWASLGFIVSVSLVLSHNINTVFLNLHQDEGGFQIQHFYTGKVKDFKAEYEGSLLRNSYLQSISPAFKFAARSNLVSLQSRNIILVALIALAPLVILLFYFRPTQEFGKFFFTLYVIELFMPMILMLTLIASKIISPGVVGLESQLTTMNILTAALLVSAALHMFFVLLAVLKSSIAVFRGD